MGFIGPLTGGNAAMGLGGRNSADLAVKLRNADPKAKYEYELVVLDDECKPNVAVQVATKAGADRAVIGSASHYCSVAAIAAVETYNRLGLPMVVWGAVLPDITYRNKFPEVHRVNGTMINQNEVAAKFMTGQGFKKWVVIHDTTDYGKGHNQYFSQYVKENGGQIVGTFGVTADQQDFTAELTQAKALAPEVIYFGGLTPIGIRIRSQMDKLGLSAVFEGTSGIKSDAFIQGLGPLAEGSLAFAEGAPIEKLPGGRFFQEQYDKAGYKEPPEAYGAFAFAAMKLILDKIEEVGPDRKKVTAALGNVEGLRLHRRAGDLRRPRPEHGAADHQIRLPGRQVGDLGGQRVRQRQAQAEEVMRGNSSSCPGLSRASTLLLAAKAWMASELGPAASSAR